MCFDIIYFLCMNCCCKYSFYSKARVCRIFTKLDNNYLLKLRSDKIPIFDSWKPYSIQNRKLQYILKYKIRNSLKNLKLPIISLGKYFEEYFEIQISYLIFEIVTNTYLDIKQNKNIMNISLLEIPIQSVFDYVPKYNKNNIEILQKNFYQIKGKKIDLNHTISPIDKVLLDLKLEFTLEDIINNINFTLIIEKIYQEYNNQLTQLEEKTKYRMNY